MNPNNANTFFQAIIYLCQKCIFYHFFLIFFFNLFTSIELEECIQLNAYSLATKNRL